MQKMIKTVKDLKDFLKDFPDEMVLLSFNHDDSLPEICSPMVCTVKERDKKNGRAQHEALSDILNNVERTDKNIKLNLKIGDEFIIL